MSVNSDSQRDAYIKLQQKKLYRVVVCGITDIRQIADVSNMGFEQAEETLARIIKLADRSKDWYGFKGAYIDHEKGRIVLAVPQNELITANLSLKSSWIIRIIGYVFIVASLIFPFIYQPEWSPVTDEKEVVVGCLLLLGVSVGFVLISHFDFGQSIGSNRINRLKKYIHLISVERRTSISDIARTVGKPAELVRKDLQKDIDLHLIVNAQIDPTFDKVVITSSKSESI